MCHRSARAWKNAGEGSAGCNSSSLRKSAVACAKLPACTSSSPFWKRASPCGGCAAQLVTRQQIQSSLRIIGCEHSIFQEIARWATRRHFVIMGHEDERAPVKGIEYIKNGPLVNRIQAAGR